MATLPTRHAHAARRRRARPALRAAARRTAPPACTAAACSCSSAPATTAATRSTPARPRPPRRRTSRAQLLAPTAPTATAWRRSSSAGGRVVDGHRPPWTSWSTASSASAPRAGCARGRRDGRRGRPTDEAARPSWSPSTCPPGSTSTPAPSPGAARHAPTSPSPSAASSRRTSSAPPRRWPATSSWSTSACARGSTTAPAVQVPERDDVADWWPQPRRRLDKYTRGVVGIATGSATYPGAAVLSASAAPSPARPGWSGTRAPPRDDVLRAPPVGDRRRAVSPTPAGSRPGSAAPASAPTRRARADAARGARRARTGGPRRRRADPAGRRLDGRTCCGTATRRPCSPRTTGSSPASPAEEPGDDRVAAALPARRADQRGGPAQGRPHDRRHAGRAGVRQPDRHLGPGHRRHRRRPGRPARLAPRRRAARRSARRSRRRTCTASPAGRRPGTARSPRPTWPPPCAPWWRASPADGIRRPTGKYAGRMWQAEVRVDLDAIRGNVALLRAGTDAAVMAVVKADGYGHGMVPAARAALDGGATWLGVVHARRGADAARAPASPRRSWPGCSRPGCRCTTASPPASTWAPPALAQLGRDRRRPRARPGGRPGVHLKIDTGLARGGATARRLAGRWSRPPRRRRPTAPSRSSASGATSSYADAPGHPTIDRQLAAFAEGLEVAERLGVTPAAAPPRQLGGDADPPRHALRPGPAGHRRLRAVADRRGDVGLRPAMTARARVMLTKRVPAGQGVSYGHTYTTPRRDHARASCRSGTPTGCRGTRRSRGPVAARRQGTGRSPGGSAWTSSCSTAATTRSPRATWRPVRPGRRGEPTADDWAEAVGTINYEIVTRFGSARVPRVYDGAERAFMSRETAEAAQAGIVGAVVGLAAAGCRRRRRGRAGAWCARSKRRCATRTRTSRSATCRTTRPLTVTTADGTDLHVEIVEPRSAPAQADPGVRARLLPGHGHVPLPARGARRPRRVPHGASTTSRATAGPAGCETGEYDAAGAGRGAARGARRRPSRTARSSSSDTRWAA